MREAVSQPGVAAPEPAPEPAPDPVQQETIGDSTSPYDRRRILSLTLAVEVEQARRQATTARTGITENWARDKMVLVARVGDAAYGVTTFSEALREVSLSEAFSGALRTGAARLVPTSFVPCGDPGELGRERYEALAGKWLAEVEASGAVIELHPTFLWQCFTGGMHNTKTSTSRRRVDKLVARFERLDAMGAHPKIRALAALMSVRTTLHGYERGVIYDLLAGQRGIVQGLYFNPEGAKLFFEGTLIGASNINIEGRGNGLFEPNVRFPRAPGLAECWGYAPVLTRSIWSVASLTFDEDTRSKQLSLMAQLLSFDDTKVFHRPSGSSMPSQRVEETGREVSIAVDSAWRALFSQDVEEATGYLRDAVLVRPDLFSDIVASKLGVARAGRRQQQGLVIDDSGDEIEFSLADIPKAPQVVFEW